MKKLISIFALGILLFGITTAATWDLWDWMDNLSTETPFGYSVTQKITVDQISLDKIVIKSPVIQDEFGAQIKKYTVMYSQYPLSQILETTSLIDQSKEKTFDFPTVGTEVIMELTATGENFSSSNTYYLSIIPKNDNGILGELSNEIWFKLATQTWGEGNVTNDAAHTAPGANMSLANVTHTITSNSATLRWTAVDGSDKVDIFLWNPTSELFERLSSVNMSAESYTFTLTRNGEYIVNFMPNNGGTEYRYTFVANGINASTTTTTPVIGKIPATGPKENVLVALAIAFVLYLVYRRVRAKH